MNALKKPSSAKLVLIVAAGSLYVISPLDFVPDIIPFIGWLDDIGVITFIYKRIKAYKRQRSLAISNSQPRDEPLKALE